MRLGLLYTKSIFKLCTPYTYIMEKLILYFLLVIVNSQGAWCTVNGTGACRTEDFQQKVLLTKPECQHHMITVPNKRCVGVCHFYFKPNSRLYAETDCQMCKPELSQIEFTIFCGKVSEKVKLMVVNACTCATVDCACHGWTREQLIKYG